MASQYDNIGSKYGVFKEIWTSVMEEENIKEAISVYLRNTAKPRVLDLASGTGFYAKKLVDWGADYVLGVDLSSSMVKTAQDQVSHEDRYAGKVHFRVGNALDLGKVQGEEPFDIVLGAWLLNYAGSIDEMTKMFHSIAANLKEGGVFVGLTPTPMENIDEVAEHWPETQLKLGDDFPVEVKYYERLPSGDGWKTEVSSASGSEVVAFRNFHLKQSVYEEGAQRGGMSGKTVWPEVQVPEQLEARAGLDSEGWRTFVEGQKHMGIIVVGK